MVNRRPRAPTKERSAGIEILQPHGGAVVCRRRVFRRASSWCSSTSGDLRSSVSRSASRSPRASGSRRRRRLPSLPTVVGSSSRVPESTESCVSGFAAWMRARLVPLPGTEVALGGIVPPMFWSPDSRFVAFDAIGQLKKVDVTGGTPQTVCTLPSGAIGGSWNQDDVIVVGSPQGGLVRCPASGGAASIVTQLDTSRQESAHLLPWFLPDGRRFLYLSVSEPRPRTPASTCTLSTRRPRRPRRSNPRSGLRRGVRAGRRARTGPSAFHARRRALRTSLRSGASAAHG